MKVLTVNTFDIDGGAARAAYRLHRSLLEQGVDSCMLVQNKKSNDSTVITEPSVVRSNLNKIRYILDSAPMVLYGKRDKMLFSSAWLPFSNVVDRINEINPDIVHMHWICYGLLRIEDLAKIKAPIVWTLHDNWAFTGGCHIMWDCTKYQKKCGSCPRLGSHQENDISRYIFERKAKTFSQIKNLTIVGVSNWLMQCSEKSALLRNSPHVNLPNPLDTKKFKPFDRMTSRIFWDLPQGKKLVLFGAMNSTSDINKGFKELQGALCKVKSQDIELVVFGSAEAKKSYDFGFQTHYLEHIHDDESLIKLFSTADVVVVPSLQENLSNTIMESLSCGAPVVAFDIGGNGDMIEHKKNGYLAKPFDTQDLADGIEWVVNNDHYDELRACARTKVVENFDAEVVAKKYIALYEYIVSKK